MLPTIFGLLAVSHEWSRDLQPWIDLQHTQSALFSFEGFLTGEQWANIGVTGTIWLVIPLMAGPRFVMRSEVKRALLPILPTTIRRAAGDRVMSEVAIRARPPSSS